MGKVFNYNELPINTMTTEPSTGNKTGGWRTYRPIINLDECIKCMICWKFCPDVCINIVDEKPEIDYDFCKGCGVCANECPKKCIEMVMED